MYTRSEYPIRAGFQPRSAPYWDLVHITLKGPPLELSDRIRPIRVWPADQSQPQPGDKGKVLDWGRGGRYDYEIKAVTVEIQAAEECRSQVKRKSLEDKKRLGQNSLANLHRSASIIALCVSRHVTRPIPVQKTASLGA